MNKPYHDYPFDLCRLVLWLEHKGGGVRTPDETFPNEMASILWHDPQLYEGIVRYERPFKGWYACDGWRDVIKARFDIGDATIDELWAELRWLGNLLEDESEGE